MVKGELREEEVKTCWRCGYKITSGSVCSMCGAVNKEEWGDEERTLTAEDDGGEGKRVCRGGCGVGGGEVCGGEKVAGVDVGNGVKVAKGDSATTVLGIPAVGDDAKKVKFGGSVLGGDVEMVRSEEETGRKVRRENGGVA
jgi:hypothetical protein